MLFPALSPHGYVDQRVCTEHWLHISAWQWAGCGCTIVLCVAKELSTLTRPYRSSPHMKRLGGTITMKINMGITIAITIATH